MGTLSPLHPLWPSSGHDREDLYQAQNSNCTVVFAMGGSPTASTDEAGAVHLSHPIPTPVSAMVISAPASTASTQLPDSARVSNAFFNRLNRDVRNLIYDLMTLSPFPEFKDWLGFYLSCSAAKNEMDAAAARAFFTFIHVYKAECEYRTWRLLYMDPPLIPGGSHHFNCIRNLTLTVPVSTESDVVWFFAAVPFPSLVLDRLQVHLLGGDTFRLWDDRDLFTTLIHSLLYMFNGQKSKRTIYTKHFCMSWNIRGGEPRERELFGYEWDRSGYERNHTYHKRGHTYYDRYLSDYKEAPTYYRVSDDDTTTGMHGLRSQEPWFFHSSKLSAFLTSTIYHMDNTAFEVRRAVCQGEGRELLWTMGRVTWSKVTEISYRTKI